MSRICPTHKTPMIEGRYGLYCPNKVNGYWCKGETPEEHQELTDALEAEQRADMEESAQIEAQIAAMHPALQSTAEFLLGRYEDFSEQACIAFVLENVAKLGQRVGISAKPELRQIYKDIKLRGGAAYAEHKARLQSFTKGNHNV